MPLFDFQCPVCKVIARDLYQSYDAPAPECQCGQTMYRMIGKVSIKVWNYDPATQTGEENARMCGVEI